MGRVGRGIDAFLTEPREDAVRGRAAWESLADLPVPDEGVGIDALVDELVDVVVPHGTRISDPGFWGFITTGPSTAPVLAAAAASVPSPQRYLLTAFNRIEERSLDMLASLVGLGEHMKGVYSSGGSVANLVALGAARQHAFERAGIDPAADGLGGVRPALYASTEVHHTVQRSAGVLGLGRSCVRAVPTDRAQRADPAAMARMLEQDLRDGRLPVALVGTAGTTNTGAIDPLRAIGELAREHGVWFHVDGAYGLPGILDDRIRDRFDGLDLADSVIVDPHKWLATQVGVAATFVRDRALLYRAFTQEPAEYLEGSFLAPEDAEVSMDSMGIPYADFGVELSSPPRGIQVWAVLREQGVRGVTERIRTDNDRAARVADLARRHPRLESLTEPELSIACLRYRPDGIDPATDGARLDDLNQALLRRLVRETPYVPSATVVNGAYAIRPCFINTRTTDDMVDDFVATVARLGDELAGDRVAAEAAR